MKTEKGFRFTLQFPAKIDTQVQVGNFLEQLGSKKSRFVVQVLGEYLTQHPELLAPGGTIQISTPQAQISKEELRRIIREVIAEQGILHQSSENIPEIVDSCEDSVTSMLENLIIFG